MKIINFFLVDDDKIFVFLAKKTIELANNATEVKVFVDGQEVLDYLIPIAHHPELLPDIIFLDLSMPVMDGWEFLKEYTLLDATMEKKIPIYLVTSSISPHDIERAKTIRLVADFLIKPLTRDKVAELINNI